MNELMIRAPARQKFTNLPSTQVRKTKSLRNGQAEQREKLQAPDLTNQAD
jgi:hypothetical protein